ncbi:rhomboid-like protein [Streptomyces sp. NPDC005202]|uniref:rhomboid-like protein n=1 Tax=Streptomyces sp. NPDC005202 TaxID=3157021 RepID=UPI0033A36353
MDRTATADAAASSTPSGAPLPPDPDADVVLADVSQLLDGMPQQRGRPTATVAEAVPGRAAKAVPGRAAEAVPGRAAKAVPAGSAAGVVGGTPLVRPTVPKVPRLPAWLRGLRPWRLLPSPTGTPFTFGYAAVLAVTSLVARYADPALTHALYQSSSTDVAHLVRAPLLVLSASALWIAGGVTSPYALCFLLVLTALERRIGGLRAAGVFLFGHVLATLATEVPVGLAVLAGHLPDSSLHRLDYGISFGVAASVGALSGLLTPWLRWPLLAVFVGMVLEDLIGFTDPMTSWGHLISVGLGMATWPVIRRRHRARSQGPAAV